MINDPERTIEFEFLRATEGAALSAHTWLGKGEKELGDAAACDAIRGMFDLMDMKGEITIGEGIKDEAPGLFLGEKVGNWNENAPRFDIALDPVDGTTNLSKGMPNSISCIAAAIPDESGEAALEDIPAFYMDKLACPEAVRLAWMENPSLPISLDVPLAEVIKCSAKILGKETSNMIVMVLDRPRNKRHIDAVRSVGAKLRMIADGDIAAALAPAMPGSGVDLYAGIGGSPEGVLSAAALRCLGGGLMSRIWPRDEEEKANLIEQGWGDRFEKVYLSKDLAKGSSIIFCATGISSSPLLRGIETQGKFFRTHSVLMRVRSKTVRFVEAIHNTDKKTLRLRSTGGETLLSDVAKNAMATK